MGKRRCHQVPQLSFLFIYLFFFAFCLLLKNPFFFYLFRAALLAGSITLGDLMITYEFDDSDTLSIVQLTGAQIITELENGVSLSSVNPPVGNGTNILFKITYYLISTFLCFFLLQYNL
jgi:2',3'-cyclic-nucleotide 2'-phosphodiesterase (5'-nucleotidase family)